MDVSSRPSFAERYLRGELRLQFWSVTARAIGLANSFIVLAALSVYEFGLYQLVLAAVAIADTFSAGLFDDIVVTDTARDLAGGRSAQARRLFNEFMLFKVAAASLLTAGLWVAADRLVPAAAGDVTVLVRIASLLVLIEAVRAAQELFFTASVSFAAFGVQAVQEAVKLVALVALIAAGALSLPTLLATSVGAAALALGYSSFSFAREYRRVFGALPAARGRLLLASLRRSGGLVLVRYAASRLTKNVRPWLVKVFLGTEAVAFYALAVNLLSLAQGLFPIGMIGRLLPWEVGNERRLRFLFSRSVKYALWIGLGVAAGAFVVLPPLVSAVFPKYAPAMPLFSALLATLPFYGVYKVQKSLLLALREQGILTARLVTEMAGVAGLNAIFLPTVGLFGVAVEYTATYVWRVFLFHRLLGRAHPNLRIKVRSLFTYDDEDRRFIGRMGERLWRAFRPAAV